MEFQFLLSMVGGMFLGYLWVRRLRRKRTLHVPIQVEYRIFSKSLALPRQDQVFELAMRGFPGVSPFTPQMGLFFSDVRLRISLLLRDKNPREFVTGEFCPDAPDWAFDALDDAESCIRLLFVSEEAVADRTYLRFMRDLAKLYAKLADARAVYDVECKEFVDPAQKTPKDPLLESVRWQWLERQGRHIIESFGMRKIGLMDFTSLPIPDDYRVLSNSIVEQYVQQLWDGKIELEARINVFDDEFIVNQFPMRKRSTLLMRRAR